MAAPRDAEAVVRRLGSSSAIIRRVLRLDLSWYPPGSGA